MPNYLEFVSSVTDGSSPELALRVSTQPPDPAHTTPAATSGSANPYAGKEPTAVDPPWVH